jgi:hypothetical protein
MSTKYVLSENGFLWADIAQTIAAVREKYCDWFNLIGEANRIGHNLLQQIEAPDHDSQKLLGSALYVRTLETFEGVVVLAERGMRTQAKILCRPLLESMLLCRAIFADQAFAQKFLDHSYREHKKRLEVAAQAEGPAQHIDPEVARKLKAELHKITGNRRLNKLELEECAELAGVPEWLTAYSHLSGSVHSDAFEITNEIYLPEDNIMAWGPQDAHLELILLMAFEMLVSAMGPCDKFFNAGFEPSLARIESRKIEIAKAHGII